MKHLSAGVLCALDTVLVQPGASVTLSGKVSRRAPQADRRRRTLHFEIPIACNLASASLMIDTLLILATERRRHWIRGAMRHRA